MNKTQFLLSFNEAGLYVGAAATCLLIFLFTFLRRRIKKPQNRLFVFATLDIFFTAVVLICRVIMKPYLMTDPDVKIWYEITHYLYFVLHTVLAPVFCEYIMAVTGMSQRLSRPVKLILALPFLITEGMAITNPLHHLVYTTKGFENVRGIGEYVIYGVAAYYLILATVLLVFYWHAITMKRRVAFLTFLIMTVIGVLIQLVIPSIKVELFIEAVGMMGIMLAVENEDDRIDAVLGIYGRGALLMDLNNLFRRGGKRYVLCIRLRLMESLRSNEGVRATDALLRSLTDCLKMTEPWYTIYRITPNGLMVLSQNKELLSRIEERMTRPFLIGEGLVRPEYRLVYSEVPGIMKKPEDVLLMGDAALPPEEEGIVVADEGIKTLLRREEAEEALHRGLNEHNFEVYYQPVHESKQEKLYAAEALIRLHDSVLGELYPDEFIPVAEQNGIINEIGEFVVNEVCRFLQSGVPEKLGMDHINVNLSVVQCMQEDFVQGLKTILGHYKIRPSQINFEITESVAAKDYEMLEKVIKEFRENGFSFSMDDYGTGYSNMQSVFQLDFDVIKIDKSILWEAEKSERGRIILESSVEMIRRLRKKILVEGVETAEQVALLRELGVDYYQGYFYSRPVSRNTFVELYQSGG